MARTGSPSPRILVAGHFPPPLHGMSLATSRFADELGRRAPVVRLATSGRRHGRSASHHLVRAGRTLVVAARVLAARRRDRLYAGCDAGPGIVYVSAILAAARLRGLPRYLHHHSCSYVANRSLLMACLVRIAGPATVHVFTCERQGDAFARRYPSAVERRTVPITFALDRPVPPVVARTGVGHAPWVLGHLGNLSMAKGVGRAIATLDSCLVEGIDATLHLAGPVVDAEAEPVIAEAQRRLGDRLVQHGPLTGEAKRAFLEGLDVFLFPSRYHNESFGIVVAEAMACGVPVVAHVAGCLDATWVGAGGLVIDLDDDFVAPAARQVKRWVDQPEAYAAAAHEAYRVARRGWEAGHAGAAALAGLIAGPS